MSVSYSNHQEKNLLLSLPKPDVDLGFDRFYSVEKNYRNQPEKLRIHGKTTPASKIEHTLDLQKDTFHEKKSMQYSLVENDVENGGDNEHFRETENVTALKNVNVQCGISINRTFRMIIYCITYFLSGVSIALPIPFYPQVAEKKGISLTLTGIVFGVFEFVVFITSPFFGSYLSTIGPKFCYISGIAVGGACSILFGTLDMSPPGVPFFVLSLLVRSLGAVAFSSFLTALMSAMTMEYTANVATAMSFLEGAYGIGLMIGPAFGGVLYSYGGFGVPFYFIGCLLLAGGMLAYLIMPNLPVSSRMEKSESIFSAFRSPVTIVGMLSMAVGCCSYSLLKPTLAFHLEPFEISVLLISLFFIIVPLAYTVTSPVLGYLSDNKGIYKELIVGGHFVYGIGYLILGPSNLLPFIPNELWTVIFGLFTVGVSLGCTITPTFKCILLGLIEVGFDKNIATYGLMSGIANSAYSLGAFLGPMVGGVLFEELGDRTVLTIVGLLNIGTSIAALIIFTVHRIHGKKNKEMIEQLRNKEQTEVNNESTNLIRLQNRNSLMN